MKKVIAVIILAFALNFFAGTKVKACSVHLGDFDWDSSNIHTAISTIILEEGYNCSVRTTKGSTTPIMAALFNQQIDIITEVWRDNLVSLINQNKNKIVELGINTPHARQGFYIDRATANKYNLRSIDDMRDSNIARLFNNRLVSCISGWTCHTINFVKLKGYGLDSYYDNYDPGSGGRLDSEIQKAFRKGKPIFTYYWEPTGLLGKFDLVKLKETPYSSSCWNEMTKVVERVKRKGPKGYKNTRVCDYPDMVLTKAASSRFANNSSNKAIINFFEKYSIDTSEVNQLLAYYMYSSGGDMRKTARNFLYTSDTWLDWVPNDIATKVGNAIGRTNIVKKPKKKEPKQTPDDDKKEPKQTPDDDKVVAASSGSGFFVTRAGHLVTNYHVVEECDLVKVSFNAKEIQADTIAIDKFNDLAIIKAKINPSKVYPVSKEDVSLLQDVIVAGFPLGKKISAAIKTHKGSVTGLAGIGDNYSNFQTDATINHGNSGGPILTQKGNVIGVAVQLIPPDKAQNVFFGVKSSTLTTFAKANNVNFLSPNTREMSNKDLGQLISEATVFLECWMTVAKIKQMIAQEENRKAFYSEHK